MILGQVFVIRKVKWATLAWSLCFQRLRVQLKPSLCIVHLVQTGDDHLRVSLPQPVPELEREAQVGGCAV